MARGAYISREIVEGILMLHKVNPELKYTKIAEVYPVDASTAGKIVACGSWEGYCRFKDEKAAKQRERKAKQAEPKQMELQGGVDYQVKVNEQIEGQMKMDLPEEKTEMSDTVKMMRFLAGQFDLIEKSQALGVAMINENLAKINKNTNGNITALAACIATACSKIDKVNDYLGQILRKMDGR